MENKEIFELTNPQKSIWYMEEFFKGSAINNICGSLTINEIVDFDKLKKSINLFVQSNDSFHIRLFLENSIPKQYFCKPEYLNLEIIDLNTEDEILNIEKEMVSQPFNIIESPLFQFKVFRLPNGYGGFVVNTHHIIADAATFAILGSSIARIYANLKDNVEIDKNTPSYIDYILSEREYLVSDKFKKDEQYWNEQFESVPDVASVPASFREITNYSSNSKRESFLLPKSTVDKIRDLCSKEKISIFNFFMAIYSLYIGRVSNLDEFVIGTPILNRSNFKEKHTSGMFISTVPLKITIDNDSTFLDFVSKIAKDCITMLRHQKYPYQYLLENLRNKLGNVPNLYDNLISYQITKTVDKSIDLPYSVHWIESNEISCGINIHIHDNNDSGSLIMSYDYWIDKYSTEHIKATHERVLHIVNQLLDNINMPMKDIEIVTPEEKNKILYEFNNTKVDYPKDKTIVDLFKEQVNLHPNNIAVVYENQKLTYKQLDEKSNQLANYIINNQISPDSIISVCMHKNVDFIISILGILKSGCAYLPINSSYPYERICYIVNNSKSDLIISDMDLEFDNLIKFSDITLENYSSSSPNLDIKSDSLAYVIYTSGSTGNPKGVMLKHENLINFLFCFNNSFNNKFSELDNCLTLTNISFDVSVCEIFTPLVFGSCLVIYTEDILTNIPLLVDTLIKNNITFMYIPPNVLEEIYNYIQNSKLIINLNKLLVGVESIKSSTLNNYFSITNNLEIINGYGPTESTICCTFYKFEYGKCKSNIVPIGNPLSNNTIVILNDNLSLQPIGVPGTLYISGANVSKGYLNNDELTNKSFVEINHSIYYNTGDLAYFNNDGIINFIGRKDNQIKLHGYRIELGEITNTIKTISGILNAFTTIKNINGSDSICSYIVTNNEITTKQIKEKLEDLLPYYMIPNHIVFVDSMPLTSNGKIDKNKLPTISLKNNKNLVLPSTETEKKVAKIVKNILKINNISIDADLFELGMDSLSIIKLIAEISYNFRVEINFSDIFNNNTIKALCNFIDNSKCISRNMCIKNIEKADSYPTSSAQKRIYYSSSVSGKDSIVYNIPGGIIFDKVPDINKLEYCFNELIKRHEAFRTYFDIVDGNVVQKIVDTIDFKLKVSSANYKDLNLCFKNFVKPFNLNVAPLFRAELVKFKNNKCLLLFDMHHIVSDGASLQIFIKELCSLYNNEKLKKETLTYKDFSVWENDNLNSDKFNNDKKYWMSQFKDNVPVLDLPANYSRPAQKSYTGSKIYDVINSTTTKKITDFSKANGITPYMLLLSVYYILLSKYSMQDDIVIGSPIAARDNSQLENIIGMFVNTLPLRIKIDNDSSFSEFLSSIKNMCVNSFEHQTYPLDELINNLDLTRDTSRNPLFDVLFTYQNNGLENLNLGNIHSEYYIPDTKISKFDLSLEVIPTNDELNINFEYCTKLFNKDFVQNICNHYINILNIVLDNPEIKISDIDMLFKEEKDKIIHDFNNTKTNYPKDKSVIDLFEEQVLINKNKTALVFEKERLTYNQLNKLSNQLSNYLLEKYYLTPQDVIAIFLDKSIESILAILSIVKCGCVFVPIDTEYPEERINYILEDSKAKMVLTKEEYKNILNTDIPKICINLDNSIYKNYSDINIEHDIKPEDLIYMMYTSGSTGKPKGVMVKHQNVVRLVKNTNYIEFTPNERILQTGSIVFDASTFEIWGAFLNGGTLYLMKKQNMLDQNYFENYLKDNKITSIFLTTALFNQYCEASPTIFASLKNLLTGGEAVSIKHMQLALKNFPKLNLVHVYGPTENTTFSTYHVVKQITNNIVPIGKAIANSTTYVVSKYGQLLPIGVPGELWVGGDGVGKGYLNRDDLTNEKFIDNPFGSGKIYKTGDLVRLLPDGSIEFIGRIDNQVKIRGFRIELNEIDNVILEYPYISKAYTIVKLINDKQYIVTYFTSDKTLNVGDINLYLQEKLPFYMVPHFLINLEKFPLTINGKVDKAKLPIPELQTLHQYIPPENEIQKQLCDIWCKLFEMKKVSITDNFFELGGDSLTAIKLQTEALKMDININYSDVFEYPTIKALSEKNQDKQLYEIDKNYDYSKLNKLLEFNNINNIKNDNKEVEINNLLLCGATGFLGAHILDNFLSNTNGNIYCLVRKKGNIDSVDRLKKLLNFYFEDKYDNYFGSRIFVIYGDITLTNFGLNEKEYQKLGKQIDVVVNSAALVKHFGDFKMFQSINVLGTKNIIEFCKDFNIKLYHISTMSVAGINTPDEKINNDEERILFNETNLYIGQNMNNAYVYTKFEAEKEILEEIENGLQACILRMGNISNRISDGKFQINVSENAFINRIKSLLNIKVIQNKFLNHAIEFTPVDSSADAIVKIIKNNPIFTVLHVFNTKVINIPDVLAILTSLGYNIKTVDDKTFVTKIKEFLKDDNLKNKISGLIPDLNSDKTLSLLSKTLPNAYFTTLYLNSIGFSWPDIDKDYIKKYMDYFRKIGYIE